MSHVYDVIAEPDWAGCTTISAPRVGAHDAREWAAAIFDSRSAPLVVKALVGAREVVALLLRIPRGDPSMLRVDRVQDGEALIDTDDEHLHFVAGVRTDPGRGLLHVETVVRFKGLTGRLYFLPVRVLHDPITRAMMSGAARRLRAA